MSNEIVWLNPNVDVELSIDEQDRVRLELGSDGIVLLVDRYQLHLLIIELDRRLSRIARPSMFG